MAVRALRLVAGRDGVEPVRTELDEEIIRAFARTKLQSDPTAYIVFNNELSEFTKIKDLVIDRGRKHEAKPLAKLLLGYSRVPAINGSYESSGQLLRSIRALLDNAFEKDDHNLYIIGANKEVFDELWKRAARTDRGAVNAARRTKAVIAARHRADNQSRLSSEAFLRLLDHREIPEQLVRTFIGSSPEVELVRQLVMRAAASTAPVLILGDTGTGKEVVARSIHNYSPRASEKFVPVNCAAIPTELLESELFGHKKYVFTDAKFDKKGLWEITGKGTLFLDEIGDLAGVHQVKLLRALEQQKIRPIGEPEEVEVEARVIAATNRDLFSLVRKSQFREDLYYRLRTFLIRTPALRNHPEDVPLLARNFWITITGDARAVLPDDIMTELISYGWPGNARELKAVLTSLYGLFGPKYLDVSKLRAVFQIEGQVPTELDDAKAKKELIMHRVDCLRHLRRIDEVLRACVVSAQPVIDAGETSAIDTGAVEDALKLRLSELEALCMRPLLFHSETTFDVVDGAKEKLSQFTRRLSQDSSEAASYWNKEVARDLKVALSAIFQETDRLESNI